MFKNLTLALAGAASTSALFVACSDDSPAGADAAVCTCEPAEPPLAGRIVRVEDRRTQSTLSVFASVACPEGSILLGGGCYGDGVAASLRLIDSGSAEGGPLGWTCDWNNESLGEAATGVAWATCLLPAP